MPKFKQASATLVISAMLGIGAASAADLPMKAPPMVVPVIYNWGGWYIGANGGYGWGTGVVEVGPTNNAASIGFFGSTFPSFIPSTIQPQATGGFGGGQIGYNWQRDRLVIGGEFDVQGANVSGSSTIITAPLPIIITTVTTQRLDWFGTARGRVGFAADNFLLYTTAGLAFGQVNHAFATNNGIGGASAALADRSTNAGFAVGAGFEWGFAPRWSAKFEYLYFDLGNHTFSTIPGGVTPPGASIDARFQDRFQVVRAGVNYRFDWGMPVVAKY